MSGRRRAGCGGWSGEDAAFVAFRAEWLPVVSAACRRWFADAGLREEAEQDVFVKLWRSGAHLRADARRWVWWALRDCRADTYERAERIGRAELRGDVAGFEGPALVDVESEALGPVVRSALVAATRAVDGAAWGLLRAHAVEGVSWEVLARREGRTVDAVRNAGHAARRRVRAEFERALGAERLAGVGAVVSRLRARLARSGWEWAALGVPGVAEAVTVVVAAVVVAAGWGVSPSPVPAAATSATATVAGSVPALVSPAAATLGVAGPAHQPPRPPDHAPAADALDAALLAAASVSVAANRDQAEADAQHGHDVGPGDTLTVGGGGERSVTVACDREVRRAVCDAAALADSVNGDAR